MEALNFWILCIVTSVSAILVVFLRKPLLNVLFMVLTMIGLAGLFLLLHAEFVAMVQLIVYAGAIMVLFLFVVMLLNLERLGIQAWITEVRGWAGALAALCLFGLLIVGMNTFWSSQGATEITVIEQPSNTEVLAGALFTQYLLPFEIASVLLLAAIIGTVVLARRNL